MSFAAVLPFIIYVILVFLTGIFFTRFSSKGISEFFLGGRKVPRLVVAISAVVSGRSAWLIMVFTGQAYLMGLSALWAVAGYIIVELLLFLFYAPRIRRFTGKHDCITLPDFFAARFGDRDGRLRILLVSIIMIFMVAFLAAQFVAGAKVFLAFYDVKMSDGILLTALIIFIYTFLGGFMAVSLTDVLQAFVLLLAMILLIAVAIVEGGGVHNIVTTLHRIEPAYFNPLALSSGMLIGFLGIGLGSTGSPHIIVRYMSISDPTQFRWTAVTGTIWNILLASGALIIGMLARFYYHTPWMIPGADPENSYAVMAMDHLPQWMTGILLASVFAAIMSTADSQLLVAASGIVRDVYEKILMKGKETDQRDLILLSRLMVCVLVLVATILGLVVRDLVLWFVLFAWAGLGAAIGPTSILALFSRRVTKQGVMWGMVAGTVTVFVWKSIPTLNHWLYELIPGFLMGWVVTWWVSVLGKR